MARLPALTARDVIRALERAGFVCVRTKGSHRIYEHRDDRSRRTVIADHRGRTVPRGTLHDIVEQAGLTVEEFAALL